MQKTLLFIGATLLFISCSKKESKENLHITGNIEGFKKGTVYIQKVKNDTILEPIDTIKINGDSHFVSDINLKEPEMLYLFIDRGVSNSIDNNLAFFAEPGVMNINTTLDFFTADAKITGSKNQELYDEYKKVASRYVDANLDLIKKEFEAQKKNDTKTLAQIQKDRESNISKKYLYSVNFAVNNKNYEVSPYVTLAEIYDINLKYLDTIQKSLTPKINNSLYGKKLKVLIDERKKLE